jgi:endonuclease YncB( thermonuclease family)
MLFRKRWRQRRWRLLLALRIVMMCLATTAAVLLLEMIDETVGSQTDTLQKSEAALSSPPPLEAKIEGRTDAAIITEALSQPGQDLSHLPLVELQPPYLSVDGSTLMWGDRQLRFHGIDGPSAIQVCMDEVGQRWACGLQARAALHNLLAGRSLICAPRMSGQGQDLTAVCRLTSPGMTEEGISIARELVRRGWARPSDPADGYFTEAEAAARKDRAGLWRGDWTFVPTASR